MSKVKKILRMLLPAKLRNWLIMRYESLRNELRLARAFFSDYRRYRKYSCNVFRQNNEHSQLSAMIIMEAHSIEKGFSLPEIRPAYGVQRIEILIKFLRQYSEQGYDRKCLAFQKAQSVLAEYVRYHEKIGYDLGAMKNLILPWVNMSCGIGGYVEVKRDTLQQEALKNFESCAWSRSSIRQYTDEPVPVKTIRDAVQIARKTPSVCNRQAWHTYIVKTQDLKESILELQNGNRGFGMQADFLAVITVDVQSFAGAGERNEAYIDGGLFSMSLMYAFHYKGIGACPLNWMVEPPIDCQLRGLLGLKPSENVIMIICAGSIPPEVRIAKSVRKGIDDQLSIL